MSEAGEAGPSRPSPRPIPSEQQETESVPLISQDLVDTVLDVVWAVDLEIEIRREVAESAGQAHISLRDEVQVKGKAKGKDTPTEEARVARLRLAEIVRGLMVSC